jgi:hypothetical protein
MKNKANEEVKMLQSTGHQKPLLIAWANAVAVRGAHLQQIGRHGHFSTRDVSAQA